MATDRVNNTHSDLSALRNVTGDSRQIAGFESGQVKSTRFPILSKALKTIFNSGSLLKGVNSSARVDNQVPVASGSSGEGKTYAAKHGLANQTRPDYSSGYSAGQASGNAGKGSAGERWLREGGSRFS